ncbi:MAG: TRAP transporter small permease [Syntrophales bacterium]|nr:TRAP transporter small permease [Syntrophales bacterium]
MRRLINLIDGLSGLSGWLAAVMAVTALTLTVGEIVLRTFFSSTLYITDEYTGYLMAMLTFSGLSYTLRERGHIRMMMLPHFLKGKARTVFNMVCYLVGLAFTVFLTYCTFNFFWDSFVNESRSMHVSETYLAIPQIFLPLGSAMLGLQFLAEFLKAVAVLRGDTAGLRILEETDELGR